MRQADHEGVVETLAYPNQTVWNQSNLPGRFGNCGGCLVAVSIYLLLLYLFRIYII